MVLTKSIVWVFEFLLIELFIEISTFTITVYGKDLIGLHLVKKAGLSVTLLINTNTGISIALLDLTLGGNIWLDRGHSNLAVYIL